MNTFGLMDAGIHYVSGGTAHADDLVGTASHDGILAGMSTQITVRLPDEQVNYLDAEVAAGHATSRAAAITKALRREQRIKADERDLRIIQAADRDPDQEALQTWADAHQAYPAVD
ncbi:MAG TPA: ribbon-helix-helix domain-containing protein [Nakamurella sp.]|nr:ribbon-helix-helix domain-containing protein [Nakamurella sp.]